MAKSSQIRSRPTPKEVAEMQQAAARARCGAEAARIVSSITLVEAQPKIADLVQKAFRLIFVTLVPSIVDLMRECIPRYCRRARMGRGRVPTWIALPLVR